MNRLLSIQPPSGTQSTVYTYDALGNPKTAQSGISHWSATYNKRGMLTGETLQVSGQPSKTLGYLHSAYGYPRQVIYPDGQALAYGPDALGRPTQVGTYATAIDYFANGERTKGTWQIKSRCSVHGSWSGLSLNKGAWLI